MFDSAKLRNQKTADILRKRPDSGTKSNETLRKMTMNKKYIASFSGGKDSTAMVLKILEHNMPLDEIVFFDTGWEFPQMIDHIDKFEKYIGHTITRLNPRRSFTYWMIDRPIKARKGPNKGKVHRIGNGWPSPMRRWCTREKVSAIEKHCGKSIHYIGYAMDEVRRVENAKAKAKDTKNEQIFPLVDFGLTEHDCLKICYNLGFDWGGLYEHFRRVSCFCCPLQRIGELKKLRRYFPELWKKMLDWDRKIGTHNKGFRGYQKVIDLEDRFAKEDQEEKRIKSIPYQMDMFDDFEGYND